MSLKQKEGTTLFYDDSIERRSKRFVEKWWKKRGGTTTTMTATAKRGMTSLVTKKPETIDDIDQLLDVSGETFGQEVDDLRRVLQFLDRFESETRPVINHNDNNARQCIECGSPRVIKNGRKGNKQEFYCNCCGIFWTATQ
jgi:hypothetical protein